MYDAAVPMEVIQTKQNLFCNLFDQGHGYASVIPPLDQAKKILAQNLEDHADMSAVWSFMLEGIQQTDNVLFAGMIRVGLDDLLQKLDLVDGRLGVMSGGPDHFQSDMPPGGGVSGQPDGGEMTPAELPDDNILAILECFANIDGMIAAFAVILRVLLFCGDLGSIVWGGGGGRRSTLLTFLVGQGGIGTVGTGRWGSIRMLRTGEMGNCAVTHLELFILAALLGLESALC